MGINHIRRFQNPLLCLLVGFGHTCLYCYSTQIVIEGVIGDGYTSDIAVDNVRLSISETCIFTPTNARQEMSGLYFKERYILY